MKTGRGQSVDKVISIDTASCFDMTASDIDYLLQTGIR
jgi:hypothetical protein